MSASGHSRFSTLIMTGYKRVFYRQGRPTRVGKVANDLGAWLGKHGIGPRQQATMDVRGRVSGEMVSMPIVITHHGDHEYLVSMLGAQTNWVKNVHAANGEVMIGRQRRRVAVLHDVPVEQRAPIIKQFLHVAPGARPHIPVHKDAPLAAFEAIAAEYPVFRIDYR